MLKQSVRLSLALLLGVYALPSAAKVPGKLFEVTATGTPTPLSITVCLNAKGPLSCQNYQVTGTNLSIKTVIPGRVYPSAGVKVNTPGYVPTGCASNANGYCVFTASDTSAKTIPVIQNNTSTTPIFSAGGFFGIPNVSSILLGTSPSTAGGTWNMVSGMNQAFQSASCSDNGVCIANINSKKMIQAAVAQTSSLYISTDGGSTWAPTSIPETKTFGATSCANTSVNDAICVAGGYGDDDSAQLYYTTDKGVHWNTVNTGVSTGYFNSVSCASLDSGAAACMAVGRDPDGGIAWLYDGAAWTNTGFSDSTEIMSTDCYVANSNEFHCVAGLSSNLIYEYTEQTGNWTIPAGVSSIPNSVQFYTVSCTDDGSICTAGGHDNNDNTPALYTRTNADWTAMSLGSGSGGFNSLSCSGTSGHVYCAGVIDSGVLWESTDGTNWSAGEFDISPSDGLNTVNCSGSGSSLNCVTGGNNAMLYSRDKTSGKWIFVSAVQKLTGRVTGSSCFGTGANARCLAVGDLSSQKYPVLSNSIDGGINWAVTKFPDVPGAFATTSCTGAGTNTVCIAGGAIKSNSALAYLSLGGKAWSPINSLNALTEHAIGASSCTGSGSSAVCMLGGSPGDRTARYTLRGFAYLSQNGGNSWTPVTFPTSPDGGVTRISCSGTVCAMITANSLYVSNPVSATNWSDKTSSALTGLDSLSCTGTGATAICAATGNNSNDSVSSYLMSTDGGAHWISGTFPGVDILPTSVSCQGSEVSAFCIASVGSKLYNWTATSGWKLVLTDSGRMAFSSISCSTDFSLCAAVGGLSQPNNTLPILYQSKNKGLSWSAVNVSGISNSALRTVSCTGSGSTAVCFAGTGSLRNRVIFAEFTNPLTLVDSSLPAPLYMTRNGGQSWSAVSGDSTGGFISVSASK